MGKRTPKYPKEVTTPIIEEIPYNLEKALLKTGLTPEESVSILIGSLDKISQDKRNLAEVALRAQALKTFFLKFGKLEALRKHYDLNDPNLTPAVWAIELCLRICEDLIEGFDVETKPQSGRRKEWTPVRLTRLLLDIRAIKQEKRCNDSEALRIYIQRQTGKKPDEKKVRSLQNRLVEAKDRNKNIFLRMVLPGSGIESLGSFLKIWEKDK